MRPSHEHTVFGRQSELAALEGFVDAVATGPAVLVLEGDAGIGKTTLWRQGILIARQHGFTVLEAQPVEAETKLAFTAVGDLVESVLASVLDDLPAPQARALRVALALEPTPSTPLDQRAVALAVLAVLRSLALVRPLVLAIDDAQWLDAASSTVLAFASRRLHEERVGLLLGIRSGEVTQAGLGAGGDRLAVGPLPPIDLHRLVRERLGVTVPRPIFREIYAAAQGNPFYTIELCRRVEAGSDGPVPGGLPITEGLRAVLGARLGALPQATRRALTIVAALGQPTVPLLAAAGSSKAALRPALEAAILDLDGERLRFDHPLMAAAAYADVPPSVRMAVHRRLAEIVSDAEERAHHLALATDSPSADTAAALEVGAAQARARGATSTAGQLFERAARLTPEADARERHRRLVAAANEHFTGGDTMHAIALFDEAVASAASGTQLAEALAGVASAWVFEGDQPKAAELLRRVLEEPEVPLAVRADAADHLAGVLFYMREDLETAAAWCEFALQAGRRLGDATFLERARATAGDVLALLGRPLPPDIFAEGSEFGGHVVEGPAFNNAVYLLWTDRLSESSALMNRCRDDAVRRGDESSLPLILAQLAQGEFLMGHWVDAAATAAEAYELALQTGQRMQQAFALSARALVHGAVGRHPEARADAARTIELSGGRAMGVARIHARWAVATLDLSIGRPAEVVRRLEPLREQLLAAGVREPGTIRFVADEIEALIMLGRLDEADAVLRWLAGRADDLGRVSARATALRCQGLLNAARGDAGAGVDDLRRAMAEHDRDGVPFERARSLLVLGSLLRRVKRRSEAREVFAEAIAGFDTLGAVTWRDRGRDELHRIGGRRSTGVDLTSTEQQTATLVAEGLSNKEIAAQLFVTARTIETRLARMYEKVGVHSRTELVRNLFGGGPPRNL